MQNYNFNYYQYKKKINHSNGFAFPILFIFIIILMGIAVYIKPIKSYDFELYFVKVCSFSSYQKANEYAQSIQNNGGAGYIYYDEQYHVLANYYHNKEDAELVLDNLVSDYPDSEIYSIECKNYKNSQKFNEKQNKSIQDLSNYTISAIKKLSTLSIAIDKNEINFNQLSTNLKDLYSNFKDLNVEFFNQFKTNSKLNVSKEYSYNIENSLLFLTECSQSELIKNFKYKMIDVVVNYSSFLSSF